MTSIETAKAKEKENDPSTENVSSFLGYLNLARVKVAGGMHMKLIYFVVLACSLVTFLITVTGIFAGARETFTSTSTELLEEITYPNIFFCLNSRVSDAITAGVTSVTIKSQDSCDSDTYIEISGTIETWVTAGGSTNTDTTKATCKDATTSNSDSDVAALETYFGTDHCFLINTDKSFKPSRSTNQGLMVGITLTNAIEDVTVYGIVGVYEHGSSPVKNSKLVADTFRMGFQDTLGSFGLSMSKEIDKTGSYLFPSGAEEQSTRNIYKMSYDSFSTELNAVSTGIVPDASSALSSYYNFYVSDFISHTTIEMNKSGSEIWAALGGALTAAIAIVYFFFKEEVVVIKENNKAEKVMVFRFQSTQDVKDAVASWQEEVA